MLIRIHYLLNVHSGPYKWYPGGTCANVKCFRWELLQKCDFTVRHEAIRNIENLEDFGMATAISHVSLGDKFGTYVNWYPSKRFSRTTQRSGIQIDFTSNTEPRFAPDEWPRVGWYASWNKSRWKIWTCCVERSFLFRYHFLFLSTLLLNFDSRFAGMEKQPPLPDGEFGPDSILQPVACSEEETSTDRFLQRLGRPGLFQMMQFFLLSLLFIPCAMNDLIPIFYDLEPTHVHCVLPEPDSSEPSAATFPLFPTTGALERNLSGSTSAKPLELYEHWWHRPQCLDECPTRTYSYRFANGQRSIVAEVCCVHWKILWKQTGSTSDFSDESSVWKAVFDPFGGHTLLCGYAVSAITVTNNCGIDCWAERSEHFVRFISTQKTFSGCAVGGPVFGWMADRFGRRLSLMIANLLYTGFNIGLLFSRDFVSFAALRFSVGFARQVSRTFSTCCLGTLRIYSKARWGK